MTPDEIEALRAQLHASQGREAVLRKTVVSQRRELAALNRIVGDRYGEFARERAETFRRTAALVESARVWRDSRSLGDGTCGMAELADAITAFDQMIGHAPPQR